MSSGATNVQYGEIDTKAIKKNSEEEKVPYKFRSIHAIVDSFLFKSYLERLNY